MNIVQPATEFEARPLDEVTEVLGRTRNWVVEKLALFLEEEARTSPEPWLDLDTFERVREASTDLDLYLLKPSTFV